MREAETQLLGFLLILEPFETDNATVPNPIFHFVYVLALFLAGVDSLKIDGTLAQCCSCLDPSSELDHAEVTKGAVSYKDATMTTTQVQ